MKNAQTIEPRSFTRDELKKDPIPKDDPYYILMLNRSKELNA